MVARNYALLVKNIRSHLEGFQRGVSEKKWWENCPNGTKFACELPQRSFKARQGKQQTNKLTNIQKKHPEVSFTSLPNLFPTWIPNSDSTDKMKDGCRSNGICLSGDDGDNNQYEFNTMITIMMMMMMMMMMNFLTSVYLNDKDEIEKSEVGNFALIFGFVSSSHQFSSESL